MPERFFPAPRPSLPLLAFLGNPCASPLAQPGVEGTAARKTADKKLWSPTPPEARRGSTG